MCLYYDSKLDCQNVSIDQWNDIAQLICNCELWYTIEFEFLLFTGIGYACAIIVFLLNCDYNIILTWAFYYLFSSFTMELPWSHCRNEWNTPSCKRIVGGALDVNETTGNQTSSGFNFTMGQNFSLLNSTSNIFNYVVDNFTASANQTTVGKTTDPVTEFWEWVEIFSINSQAVTIDYIALSLTFWPFWRSAQVLTTSLATCIYWNLDLQGSEFHSLKSDFLGLRTVCSCLVESFSSLKQWLI